MYIYSVQWQIVKDIGKMPFYNLLMFSVIATNVNDKYDS